MRRAILRRPYLSITLLSLSATVLYVGCLAFLDKEDAANVSRSVVVTAITTDEGRRATRSAVDVISVPTIASQWQADEIDAAVWVADAGDPLAPSTFDPDYIYESLKAVKISSSGDVVLDNDALIALEKTLNLGTLQIDALGVSQLQEFIQIGLPGLAGEQTARIVGDYYRYLVAKEQVGQYLDAPRDIEQQRRHLIELVELREMYLGEHVASQLFSQSDANANYMLDVMAIGQVADLSVSQRAEKRKVATDRFVSQMVTIANWEQRYKNFESDKQAMLARGGDSVVTRELDDLLQSHFSEAEVDQLLRLNLVDLL